MLFIAIAARAVNLSKELVGETCQALEYSVRLQNVSDTAGSLLCKGCPCYFPNVANYSDEGTICCLI